jgi:hypothetical protein
MAQPAVMMGGTSQGSDQNLMHNEVYFVKAIIGIIFYIVVVAPIFSLLAISAFNLTSAYIMPVFIMFLMAGIYVTENIVLS